MPVQPKDKAKNRSLFKAVLASPYFLPTATILPTVLSYLLSRRIKPRATPGAEALAEKIRSGGIGITTDPTKPNKMNPVRAMLQYGTPHVGTPEKLPESVKTVIYPFPKELAQAERPVIGNAPMFAGDLGKLKELEHLRATAGGHAAPHSTSAASHVDEILKMLPPEARLKFMSQNFARAHPNQYVIKPDITRGKTEPLHSGHNLVDEYNNLFKFDFAEPHPEWDELAKRKAQQLNIPQTPMNLAAATNLIKANPEDPSILAQLLETSPKEMHKPLMAFALAHAPKTMFVQDRVPMIAEYRMHVLNGRLIPHTTVPRHDKMQALAALMGHESELQRQSEAKVMEHILGRMHPEDLKDRMLSMDVAIRPDGTPTVLELNPMGWSGFLTGRGAGAVPAAINMHKWMGELAGQSTIPMAGAKALGIGAIGAGAAYGAQRLAGDDPTETERRASPA